MGSWMFLFLLSSTQAQTRWKKTIDHDQSGSDERKSLSCGRDGISTVEGASKKGRLCTWAKGELYSNPVSLAKLES